MAQITQSCAEIALIFDRAGRRPSVREFQLLSGRIRQVDGVVSVMTRLDSHVSQRVIVFFHEGVAPQTMLRRMAAALRPPAASDPAPSNAASATPVSVPGSQAAKSGIAVQISPAQSGSIHDVNQGIGTRLRQFTYGTLAAGSFAMAWVGLVVPGIPTVPFVILTAALAAKSSPAFHRRLMQSRVFGPMIKDWQTYHAIRPEVRTQAIIATLVIVCLTLIVAAPSPTLYAIVGVMAAFSLVVIFQLPLLREENQKNRKSTAFSIAAVA